MSGKDPDIPKSNRLILLHKYGKADDIGNWPPTRIVSVVPWLKGSSRQPIGSVRRGSCSDKTRLVEGLVCDTETQTHFCVFSGSSECVLYNFTLM